jgi:hypothetical protein
MSTLTLIKDSLLHLFYPHVCAGCGTDILPAGSNICVQCIHNLPFSGFEKMDYNRPCFILPSNLPYKT